jgi:hypothetical protein
MTKLGEPQPLRQQVESFGEARNVERFMHSKNTPSAYFKYQIIQVKNRTNTPVQGNAGTVSGRKRCEQ